MVVERPVAEELRLVVVVPLPHVFGPHLFCVKRRVPHAEFVQRAQNRPVGVDRVVAEDGRPGARDVRDGVVGRRRRNADTVKIGLVRDVRNGYRLSLLHRIRHVEGDGDMRPRLAVDLRKSPLGEVPTRVLLWITREDRRVDVVVGAVDEVHAHRREPGEHVGVGVAAVPSDWAGAHAAPKPERDRAATKRRGGEGRVPTPRAVDEQGGGVRAAKAVRERRARAEREVAPIAGPIGDLAV